MLSFDPRFVRALAAAVLVLGGACAPAVRPSPVPDPQATEDSVLYQRAVYAAAVYRAEDVLPLKPAVADPSGALRVVTYTTYPGYKVDTMTLQVELWVTLVPEVRDSCATFGSEPDERLHQLLGLPPVKPGEVRKFVEMTVSPADVFRPASDPAIGTGWPCANHGAAAQCGNAFPDSVAPSHVRWIADRVFSQWQEPNGYPWTRLGYTYNWHPGSPRYGASEYVIRRGSRVRVTSITPVPDYCGLST